MDIKLTIPDDCGNAPKKIVLKNLEIAFVKKDVDFISEYISEDLCWNIVGSKKVEGKENVLKTIKSESRQVIELEIIYVITHGKTAAVNGKVKFINGSFLEFCNVYVFTSAGKNIVKEITSYIIRNT